MKRISARVWEHPRGRSIYRGERQRGIDDNKTSRNPKELGQFENPIRRRIFARASDSALA